MINTIKKYEEPLHEMFQELSVSDIRKILTYSWRMIYLYNSRGLDVQIKSPNFWFFIGKLTFDPLKNFQRYAKMLARRIRYMFIKSNAIWDGYYYFALNDFQYLKYLEQLKTPTKYFKFKYIRAYRLLEECKVNEKESRYIFRFKTETTHRFVKFYPEFKEKDIELVIQRDPLNMDDLMVVNNKYKYIK